MSRSRPLGVSRPLPVPRHTYSRWRHGGWYVDDVRYPNGAVGCVSANYLDKKWRIVCDPRPFDQQPTFKTRDDAADAEAEAIRTGLFDRIRAQLRAASTVTGHV